MAVTGDATWAKWRRIGWRCAFLYALYMAGICLGGCAFHLVEYEAREEKVDEGVDELQTARQQLLSVLWGETLINNEEDWNVMANNKLDLYEKNLKEYISQGIDLQDDSTENDDEDVDNPWGILGSTFYCFTVATTIGYGNLAPATLLGKILTIMYAMVGIPFTLTLMGEMGKLLTLLIKILLRRFIEDMDSSEEFTFTLTIAVNITFAYTLVGSLIFWYLESWSLIDSFYFCFITFSTIGFGDFVPSYIGCTIAVMVYILSALALWGMCFSVLQAAASDFLGEQQHRFDTWLVSLKASEAKSKPENANKNSSSSSEPANRDEDSSVRQRTNWRQGSQENENDEDVEDVEIEYADDD